MSVKRIFNNRYIKLFLAFLIGIIVGLIALLYNNILDYFTFSLIDIGMELTIFHRLSLVFVPALGGLIVGFIIKYGSMSAKGHGIPAILSSIETKERHLTYRDLLTEGFASAITISSGGSGGRIGPIVEIGAGIGDLIAYKLDLDLFDYQTFLGCGAAAGIAGLFHAPLGGIMFVTEILFNKVDKNRLIMVAVSAISADMVIRWSGQELFLAHLNLGQVENVYNFITAALIGIFAAVFAVAFVYTLRKLSDIFDNLKLNIVLKPALGGLLLGMIAFKLPEIMGSGNRIIVELFNQSEYDLKFLFILLVLKIIATALTLGSGGSGGIFSPSLLIGSLTGIIIGGLSHQILPFLTGSSSLYALIGMAAVISAVIRAPLTATFIILEFTHNYSLTVPLLISSLIAERAASKSGLKSAYSPDYFERL
ncbi:MAG: chloride channel protein, CIC family [Halanaerobium sp. 4-GBenrich]|uniref:CIC family chloride channel protein n=1 Tax=Halanaerobium congolense TaxID=54121 RepID=A0A1G7FCC4_9FIRM|nr:chloride channel protein [Halanaerobium congolense]KXS50210.1 MAG: chloride channel protein, CIC family [Halanaerobium sp. T82-1]ODS50955.1 MAG: chloride channel protein, CIC family [Halanaerobium sp. 4-GBenrich]PTX17174.1 CIC family chloride channel protein [Halanaerobium congolense]PXV69389.1 CIC family chloride channel protein [Halanaerobium congolense]TDX46839.1 CIC family chloride channel protein [Halanaerobium congolense]